MPPGATPAHCRTWEASGRDAWTSRPPRCSRPQHRWRRLSLGRRAHRADHTSAGERNAAALIAARTATRAGTGVALDAVDSQRVRRGAWRRARKDAVTFRVGRLAGRVDARVFAARVRRRIARAAAGRLVAVRELTTRRAARVAGALAARSGTPLLTRRSAGLTGLTARARDLAVRSAGGEQGEQRQHETNHIRHTTSLTKAGQAAPRGGPPPSAARHRQHAAPRSSAGVAR